MGIAISSHRYDLPPESIIKGVNATSPISIAFPNGEQPPLVLDMGAHMLPWGEELFAQIPFAFFKELGIGAVNRALGGVLAGIYLPQFIPPTSPWESNQGAFLAAFDVRAFMPLAEFQAQMDSFVAAARNMQPFPGLDRAELPGNLEWQREREYAPRRRAHQPPTPAAPSETSRRAGSDHSFRRLRTHPLYNPIEEEQMTQPRILSSVEIEFQGQSQARELIERAGFAIEVRHPQPGWPDEETRAKLDGLDALLAGGENLNAATMDQATNLKIIARNGVGFDKVDLDYCTQRGIVVTNTPGAMADAVADLTFALLLGMVRSLRLGDHRVKTEDAYDVPVGEDLCAMTLGLVGCGRIGAEVVRRARGFKMRVLVHDPYIDDAQIRTLGAEPADRAALLSQADAVTLHLPLTEENHHLVNAEFLSLMKEGAYLINTARGGLVDEAALITALDNGHLGGAGLDCQATEPPPRPIPRTSPPRQGASPTPHWLQNPNRPQTHVPRRRAEASSRYCRAKSPITWSTKKCWRGWIWRGSG